MREQRDDVTDQTRDPALPPPPTEEGLLASLPEPLRAGAQIARKVSGCDETAAILIALAAQGAAAGPSHRLASPRGDSWAHAGIDLLLLDNPGGDLGAALSATLSPVTGRAAEILSKYEPLPAARLRARWAHARERRARLDAQIGLIDSRLEEIERCHAAGQMPPGGWAGASEDLELAAARKRLLKEAGPIAIEEAETGFATRCRTHIITGLR